MGFGTVGQPTDALRLRMLVLDVDGTVLTGNHEVTPSTRKAIRYVSGTGVNVVLASARSPNGLRPIVRRLGLEGPHVAFQGALTCRYSAGRLEKLVEAPLPPGPAARVMRAALASGLSVSWFAEDRWIVPRLDTAVLRESAITGEQPLVDPGMGTDGRPPDVLPYKLLCMAESEGFVASLHDLATKLPNECEGQYSHRNYLEVTQLGVDKSRAIEALASRMGVRREEVVAVGDGENDMALLAFAGVGVAMGHASERVRSAADWTTEANDREGVAAVVEELRMAGRL